MTQEINNQSQQGVQLMFDYLREDIQNLRKDMRDDMKAMRDELKEEIGKIASTLEQHTTSDASNFTQQNKSLQSIDTRIATLETTGSTISSFKDKIFGRATGWIVALASLALVVVEWWFKG